MIPMTAQQTEQQTKPMTEMERILTNALRFEQDRNATLNERIMELETENKTLILKLQARYATRVDDA